MKAAVFYGQEDVRIEERPIPVPGPNQLVVKINYVGICGSDVETYRLGKRGIKVDHPFVLGHENVGTVTAVGEGVTEFQIGERILCGPPSHCAEDCPSCRRGETNICIHAVHRTAGIGGPDGGYAEYMLVRDVKHTMLVKVPDEVDLKDAVLFDVICVSLHGIRKSGFKLGDNVVVSGTGAIGLAAIQFLKAGGANKIIALGTSPSKYPLLKRYGADYCLNPKELGDGLGAKVRKILGSEVGADVVYECAGNQESLINCIFQCVRPGGEVMVLGTLREPLDHLAPGRCSIFEPDLKFSFVYTPEEVQMYLEMLAAGKVEFPDMVTDVVSLDECVTMGLDRKDRSGMIKILIDPSK